MTDRVDLDAFDVGDEDEEDEPRRGDWFWHGEGDPTDEPTIAERASNESTADDATDIGATEADAPNPDAGSVDDEVGATPGSEPASTDTATSARTRLPHVPRENENKPVGIPVEGGGAGATSARGAAGAGGENGAVRSNEAPGSVVSETDDDATASPTNSTTLAAHSSKSAPSAVTMAFTYGAMKRLSSPILVLANAAEWTDWIGIIGNVDAYVINKFVREENLDIDFFNGAGTTPKERLREISANPNSMFAAERNVLVGTDADRAIAARTDWEFVPLTDAADAAGWDLDESEE